MPTNIEHKRQIEENLNSFTSGDLKANALHLFASLGYESDKTADFRPNTSEGFVSFLRQNSAPSLNEDKAQINEWQTIDFLFQLTDQEIGRTKSSFDSDKVDISDVRIESYLFFAIKLKKAEYRRSDLAEITREINKVFPMPVLILFQHGNTVTFSIIDRRENKKDATKDVLQKITLIKDIRLENPHRAHKEILADLALDNLDVGNFVELHKAWQKTLDVELVTNKFFRDYKTVFESVEAVVEQSIADVETARLFTQRLFNRLMFVYFIQKKGWMTFEGDTNYLRRIFETAKAKNEDFYKDRLYWVFFYGLSNVAESKEIQSHDKLEERRGVLPYLNGGLFEMERDGLDDKGKVKIPDSCFESILALFEHYNFTVEESTPLEVQVAIDPEILGRVFEELVTGRHESGSYYTPRQIVSFMCRESLKYFLAPHDSAETIAKFVDDGNGEDLGNPEQIFAALKKIRVCDPACGSGAYLLGMMQELLRLRESLFTSKHVGDASLYNRKREIIENNIYGVDKDKFAVQIASLRLWLSLAIESAEPRPLPNLKYKIGCGDSLLAPLESDMQPDLHRRALIERFRARKDEYVEAFDHFAKSEIEVEIEALRFEIAQTLHHIPEQPKPAQIILAENSVEPLKAKVAACMKQHDKGQAEKFQKQLNALLADIERWKGELNLDHYDSGEIFDWSVEFAEVFEEGGFDVVLANPPYIRSGLLKPEYKEQGLKPNFQNVYDGNADIYVYFFGRATRC